MNRERIHYIDIAKGIGIICVIIGHGCGFPWGFYYITASYMALFFFASGYVYLPKENVKKDIVVRLKKLLIPYFIYNILLIVTTSILGIQKNNSNLKMSILGILYSRSRLWYQEKANNVYFFNSYNDSLWFITCMIISSIFFILVMRKCEENSKCLMFSVVLFIVMTCLLSRLPILLPWSIDTAFTGALFMMMGYKCKNRKCLSRITLKRFFCLLVIYLLLCKVNPRINMSTREYGTHGCSSIIIFILIGTIGAILVLKMSQMIKNNLVVTLLETIGKNSMLLLALHVFFMEVLDSYFVFPTDGWNLYIYGYIKIFVVITICLLISAGEKKLLSTFIRKFKLF